MNQGAIVVLDAVEDTVREAFSESLLRDGAQDSLGPAVVRSTAAVHAAAACVLISTVEEEPRRGRKDRALNVDPNPGGESLKDALARLLAEEDAKAAEAAAPPCVQAAEGPVVSTSAVAPRPLSTFAARAARWSLVTGTEEAIVSGPVETRRIVVSQLAIVAFMGLDVPASHADSASSAPHSPISAAPGYLLRRVRHAVRRRRRFPSASKEGWA